MGSLISACFSFFYPNLLSILKLQLQPQEAGVSWELLHALSYRPRPWRVTPSPQLRMLSGQWFSIPCSPQGAQLFYSCIWGRDGSGKEPVEAFLHRARCGVNTGLCSYRTRERDEPQHRSSRKALCEILAQQRKNEAELPGTKRSSEAEPQETQRSTDLCQQALCVFIIYTELWMSRAMCTG